jgi:phosphatidylinositol kinase/protein kinase (PI-3  family)
MDGPNSVHFHMFRELCVKTFMLLRQHHHYIELMVEMLSNGNEGLHCFNNNPQHILDELRHRFRPDCSDREAIEYVHRLIDESGESWRTTCYDRYQRHCVGIL